MCCSVRCTPSTTHSRTPPNRGNWPCRLVRCFALSPTSVFFVLSVLTLCLLCAGAVVHKEWDPQITHLIAAKDGSEKVYIILCFFYRFTHNTATHPLPCLPALH